MTDDFTFDWVALAPIEEVARRAEELCVARGLGGLWYSSARDGVPVRGARITMAGGATLAVLTLQGYHPDQTHMRLQPAARAAGRADEVAALAADLYAALRAAGWLPGEREFDQAPRVVRPHGWRPWPGSAGQPA